tara:strand:- start:28102 stop:29574 length:1473 start_codon:yes stop_codon:yes gene_type:complete
MRGYGLVFLIIFLAGPAWGLSDIEADLKAFKDNPIEYMQRSLSHSGGTRNVAPINRDFYRQKIIWSSGDVGMLSEGLPASTIEAIIDLPSDQVLHSLEAMDQQELLSAELNDSPWSGDYWPIANGILASRPFDPSFMNAEGWLAKKEYTHSSPVSEVLQNDNASALLSTSEKYDLLVGSEGTLTEKMWKQGQYYFDARGEVETWMGICHGWAPAAYLSPRPVKSVEFKTAEGQTLKFYPAELRGLASFMWAEGQYRTRFLGGRCNEKEPELDEEGRLIEPQCLDTNPGNWHTIVVNQIGKARKSFIMDATYDYQVWNQPVYAYSYRYFNPNLMRPVETLAEAKVDRVDLTDDIFANHRAEAMASVVGVIMDLAYISEISAYQSEVDRSQDNVVWVRYTYDLELDAEGNIVGGEWYNLAHPDFLWSPELNSRPRTFNDFGFEPTTLSFDEPLSEEIKTKAKQNTRYGYILPTLVEALLHKSKWTEEDGVTQ